MTMGPLHPDHLSDLQRSGLTSDTIKACLFEAVRPHDIKLSGVTSAYRLPYFDLSGKKNCFERWRLFPPIKTNDGTQKYFQRAGSDPQLYLPPLVRWETLASKPDSPLLVVEGEKKAAAACQQGLPAIGVGGLWNWRQRLGRGERITIPTVDLFQWTSRTVWLVPDSDCWRADRLTELLPGFYALGQELVSRGARVEFLRLPDDVKGGAKQGLDDFEGGLLRELFSHFERVPLDAEWLKPVAAWWQTWRERGATADALKTITAEDLDIQDSVGLFTVRIAKHNVTLLFDRLTDQRGLRAELTVLVGSAELISGVDLGLQSDTGQTKLANTLKAYAASIPWRVLLQKSCALVLRRHRQGEPPAVLNKNTVVEPLSFAITPIVPRKKPTIVFGDGGKGKSTLMLLWAMMVSLGVSVAGFAALLGRVLYLDWEDDIDVHTRRLHAIRAGHPELDRAEVHYQRCAEPLAKIIHEVARTVQRDGITLVVIDSLLMAMGGDSSAEAVGKFFAALRVLRTEALCVGHVPKTQGEGQEHATVYGSVFNQNLARSVWELRTEQEVGENQAILALVHRKTNLTHKHLPIGLKVSHTSDNSYVHYEPYDLNRAAELESALPLPNRIRNLLESDGMPRTKKQIADELRVKPETVQAVLSKHKGQKWHMLGDNKAAQWTVINR